MRAAMRQTCTGPNGQWSAMRVASLLVTAVVLLMWVGFCLYEGRLIPLTWQDVTIIGGAQGAKALQSRFEWGGDGVWGRGGTGNPFFSTDTTTALRAVEVSADIMFKATMVDGVYDKDPHKYPDAVKYDTLTFTRVLDERLAVMDSTAATLCRDNGLPIVVFDLNEPANIARALQGENVGTIVRE